MTRALRSTVFVVMIVAALTGCAAGGGSAAPTSTPTESSSPTTPPTPSPAPTTPTAQIAECDALLTPEKDAELASEGHTLIDPTIFLQWSPPMQELVDAGATACMWSKQVGHLYVLVAQLPVTEDESATWISQLEALGWTQTDDPVPGTWVAPLVENMDSPPAAVYAGGVLYLANYPAILGSVAPLQ